MKAQLSTLVKTKNTVETGTPVVCLRATYNDKGIMTVAAIRLSYDQMFLYHEDCRLIARLDKIESIRRIRDFVGDTSILCGYANLSKVVSELNARTERYLHEKIRGSQLDLYGIVEKQSITSLNTDKIEEQAEQILQMLVSILVKTPKELPEKSDNRVMGYKLISIKYWQCETMKRVYVKTKPSSQIYYDINKRCWAAPGGKVNEEILRILRPQVCAYMHCESEDEVPESMWRKYA